MNTKTYENPVIGNKIVFQKTSDQTNGNYSLIEVTLAPGGGNTLHYHKTFSETFQAMEGTLAVQVSKEHKLLQPGES